MSRPNLFSAVLGESFISLGTFKKSGEVVCTPMWFAEAGGRLYLRTLAGSAKVRRVRNDPHVRLAPCTIAGEVTGTWLSAEAHALAPDDPAIEIAERALDEKYGDDRREMTRLMAEQGKELEFLEIHSPREE